jgi:hypothetical protein
MGFLDKMAQTAADLQRKAMEASVKASSGVNSVMSRQASAMSRAGGLLGGAVPTPISSSCQVSLPKSSV